MGRLLRMRGEWPRYRCAAERGYELTSSDCHLPRSQRDHARCDVGKNITPKNGGLPPTPGRSPAFVSVIGGVAAARLYGRRTAKGLFDHLVGAAEQWQRNGQPKCLGSLEVDNQFDFRGLLDGQIAHLVAFEKPTDIVANDAIRVGRRSPVAIRPPAAGNSRTLKIPGILYFAA